MSLLPTCARAYSLLFPSLTGEIQASPRRGDFKSLFAALGSVLSRFFREDGLLVA